MRLLAVITIGVILLNLFCSTEAFWGCHTPSTAHVTWFNDWDKAFRFTCPSGQAMTGFRSMYSSCHHDRVFKFACKRNEVAAKKWCHWSHYVNSFDKPVAYKCPYNGVLTGISSEHSNTNEDRRFMFRCCKDEQFHHYHCTSSRHYVNGLQEGFNFNAPTEHFLVGVNSYHDNGKEDRQWKFETCEVGRHTHGYVEQQKRQKELEQSIM